jgi:hypothetical protein
VRLLAGSAVRPRRQLRRRDPADRRRRRLTGAGRAEREIDQRAVQRVSSRLTK